jgi:hypothetical protein
MEHDTKQQLAKAGAAWGGYGLSAIGVQSWSDFAGMVAGIYTVLLICEWCWKKVIKPYRERRKSRP